MPRQRKHSTSTDHRQVYEALIELSDVERHIISPGELFTQTKLDEKDPPYRVGFWPVCQECRPFKLQESA
jgi:hypothetical protein